MEETVAALTLDKLAKQAAALDSGLETGRITAEEFEEQMTTLTAEAAQTLLALDAIEDITFDGAINAVGRLTLALYDATVQAGQLRIANVLADPSVGVDPRLDIPVSGNTLGNGTASSLAPTTSPRPQLPSIDSLFGQTPPRSGGGSPGGGSGPEEPEYWDDLIENVRRGEEAWDDYNQTVQDGASYAADLFTAVIDGSMSAREAITQLIAEWGKMLIQQGFQSLATGSLGAFGNAFSFLGGLRASGGPVRAGVPYLVNEKTANSEVFVPSQSGAILNVPQAQAALSRSAAPSPQAAIGGKVELILHAADGVTIEEVKNTAGAIVSQGLREYDRQMPSRVNQISRDPRAR